MISRNLTLKKRFFIFFFLLIVLPIFLFMTLVFERYYSALFDARLRESENLIRSYGESIEEEIKTMSLKTSALAFNREFIDLAEKYSQAENQKDAFLQGKSMENILNIYFDYSDDIITLCLLFRGDRSYIYKNPLPEPPNLMRNDDWFRQISNEKGKIFLINDLTYKKAHGTPNLRFGAAIRPDAGLRTSLEAILVLYQSRTLNSIAANSPESGRFTVLDGMGAKLFAEGSLNSRGKIIKRSYPIGNTSWSLENTMSLSEIRQPVLDSFFIFLIFMLIITALFFLFVMSQFRLIIGPINYSIGTMARLEKGDFSVRLKASPIPELNHMADSFNSMVREIENLTEEIRKTEGEKRKVEVRALQYQINPHFLSNTLNSIKIMARMIQADTIRETTTSLMRILSDTFRHPGRLNTVEQELAILRDYIQIMKIRFNNSFTVAFRLSEEAKPVGIMKLLIQPIVENAVVHGLREKEAGGRLFIKAFIREEKLVVQVVDNGEGMESLPENIPDEDSHNGMYNIGLQNVMDRIRLNYGDPYGIEITGRKNCYTKVEILLPVCGVHDD